MAGQQGAAYNAQDIALAMFERPTEPVFIPKGDKNIVLDIPDSYIVSILFLLLLVLLADHR